MPYSEAKKKGLIKRERDDYESRWIMNIVQ
jgi:hypothetical protein